MPDGDDKADAIVIVEALGSASFTRSWGELVAFVVRPLKGRCLGHARRRRHTSEQRQAAGCRASQPLERRPDHVEAGGHTSSRGKT